MIPPPVRKALQVGAGLAGLVLVFEALRLLGVLPRASVPSTGEIVAAVAGSFSSGTMGEALGVTALAWLLGVLLAAGIGVPVGVMVGLSRWADSATGRAVELLRPIPVVALVPLAVVLFGIEVSMQVFLVALACVWPVLLGSRGGVRTVDPLQVETARTFGLGSVASVFRVVLPASVPAIVTALRIGASLGVVVAVGAQLISGSPGLGTLLVTSQNAGRNDIVWACLLVTGLFGVIVNVLLAAAERGIAGWQELSTEGRR
ncbi:ABC transporter permease [Knoellia pratensis]|uniref:ABC transporter permease n=1 Tax=Knoellia pratensis TaxID=3404796 RepID=UPI00361F8E46